MDATFLRAVQSAPARAPELFFRMFSKASPDSLVRFLGEASGAQETLQVAWSLPKISMIQAAYQSALQAAMSLAVVSSR